MYDLTHSREMVLSLFVVLVLSTLYPAALPKALAAVTTPDEKTPTLTFDQMNSTVIPPRTIVYRIDKPDVRVAEKEYPNIQFEPGDRVIVLAGGCVQRGGSGDTWKRYVDPRGENSDKYYFGKIYIPGITPGIVRLQTIASRVTRTVQQFSGRPYLRLGYADNGYSDNGYYDQDNGTDNQCLGEKPAYIEITIVRNRDLVALSQILTAGPLIPLSSTNSPTWSKSACSDREWESLAGITLGSPRYEWLQYPNNGSEIDNPPVGVAGWAILPRVSAGDVPFTHPFGFDWEFYLAPDQQYLSILAPSNVVTDPAGKTDDEYKRAVRHAIEELGLNLKRPGVMGVEAEQNLFPQRYRPNDGDRVAVFGRWIVDCGHDDFHSEIHPPLLLTVARSISPDETYSSVIGRPFLVSQEFESGPLWQHLKTEVLKIISFPPTSKKVEAHPKIFPKPFSGQPKMIYFIRPASARRSPSDILYVRYNLTARTGVRVSMNYVSSNRVGVTVLMNEAAYTAPPLPEKMDWNVDFSEFEQLDKEAYGVYRDIILSAAILGTNINPLSSPFLLSGIATDLYKPIKAPETRVVGQWVSASTLRGQAVNVIVDDGQPFPIYGTIEVKWQRPRPPNPN
jgi:hypothetical protein